MPAGLELSTVSVALPERRKLARGRQLKPIME